nr:MAG TPA: hypothetical protein [Caudoviricetes sp.]
MLVGHQILLIPHMLVIYKHIYRVPTMILIKPMSWDNRLAMMLCI